jgi:hypothetical protein
VTTSSAALFHLIIPKMKCTTAIVLSALLLGCITCYKFPVYKRDLEPHEFIKRSDIPLGGGIPKYGLFYVPVQSKDFLYRFSNVI